MTFKGLDALLKFLLTSDKPNFKPSFNKFVSKHEDDFIEWHTTPKTPEELERLWSNRFRKECKRLEKKGKMGTTNYRSNYWKRISQRITLRYKEDMALMRHEEQVLETQNVLVDALNKRLRERATKHCERSDSSYTPSDEDSDTSRSSKFPSSWSISDYCISDMLNKFRNDCVKKYNHGEAMTRDELLTLNYTYLFSADGGRDCRAFIQLPEYVKRTLADELDQDDEFVFLDRSSKELCNEIEELMLLYPTHVPDQLDDIFQAVKDKAKETGLVIKVLKAIVAQYANRPDFTAMDEDVFSDTAFKPFFHTIVSSVPYCSRDGQFTQLDRRLQLRPDAMLSTTTNKNETLRCLVAEVKAPNRSSNGDFLKLAFEMKCALDTMIDHHVDNPYSLGIQVEGFTVRTYRMDLLYDHIYRMIHLRTFYLPRSAADFGVIKSAICSLLQVRKLLEELIKNIKSSRAPHPIADERKSWRRPTIFVPDQKY
ncbi:hypothetical protein LRAMOSA11500 [Lichtheimia ramosa]|uniref:Uncharacterized protein n=1 Tax=Lichtheimia ramosa TaxID=688394 RepID=A0A077WTK4_9FUNG|nr:hypothetical protein LRAMOSA11105 [Lichtheimia ramosa]CDS10622.1 hypothetical protein LRAMOSA11108 [Lichtheimia ramosa]CDS12580.1 hypothetical protein LRAMOSA11500 [Lichtheimia ramosa]